MAHIKEVWSTYSFFGKVIAEVQPVANGITKVDG
jgi:hypothetical protein